MAVSVLLCSVGIDIRYADAMVTRLISNLRHVQSRNHLCDTCVFQAVKLINVRQSQLLPQQQPFAAQYLVIARLVRWRKIMTYYVVVVWRVIYLQFYHIECNIARYGYNL